MNSEKVLKAYLSRLPIEEREALERFLPEDERLFLHDLPSYEYEGETNASQNILETVHWSWFLPTLKTFSLPEQRLFLSVLSQHAAQSLANALSITFGKPEEITEIARTYLRKQLMVSLDGANVVPTEFLPASPLNRLLHLSKKDLIHLIDLLSLYDLSSEFRQIIETKILKKIYSLLTEEQKNVLKQISATHDKNHLGPMALDRWDETEEALHAMMHRRGLMRLGCALAGEDCDLIWTLCHQLDIGRGGALFKLSAKEMSSDVAKRQVIEMMELM